MFMESMSQKPEFQVIIMAGYGTNLYPLTMDQPKVLLPIANKPLLYYSLKWIEQTTKDIIICCYPTAKEKISSYVHKVYDSALNIKVLEVPEGCGSADALRQLHKEIKQDFIIFSCDLITEIPPSVLINTHYAKNNTVTAFYYDATTLETPDSIRNTGEVVGISDKTSQIIYVESKEDLKLQGEIMIKHSILKNFPSMRIYSTLRDAHLYIFKRWILELIIKNHTIQSIKNDLIPLLVDLQHRKSLQTKEDIDSFQHNYNPDVFEHARKFSLGGKNYLPDVSCGAVIYNKGLNCRSNTIRNYSELNRAICKTTASSVPSTCDIHQKTTVGNDSIVGESCKIEESCSIKKSVVGNHVFIGKNCKISNSVIMDYARIEDGVKLDGTIVCQSAIIGKRSELKDCEVAGNNKVEEGTKAKNQQISKLMVNGE